jgi:hypothetical protein
MVARKFKFFVFTAALVMIAAQATAQYPNSPYVPYVPPQVQQQEFERQQQLEQERQLDQIQQQQLYEQRYPLQNPERVQ